MSAGITDGSFEMPFANNLKQVACMAIDMDDGKGEFAHPGAIAIVLPIVLQRSLVTVSDTTLAHIHERVVIPIADHEVVQIATVPGLCLFVQDAQDNIAVIFLGDRRTY